jgi:TPR repeat protein
LPEPAAVAEPPAAAVPPASPEALLAEVRAKKTSDERALSALGEAATAGADAKTLAKAANARGESLHAEPERARKFFEWAAEKDPSDAASCFGLARLAVVTGDVATTRDWLVKVKERGGKKLLKQIDFDPMWEIVKDDPEVRKLLP